MPGVIVTELDGRIAALSPDRTQVLFLNDTASDIWRLADGTRDFDALLRDLADAYEADAESIRAQVRETLTRFIDAELIAVQPK